MNVLLFFPAVDLCEKDNGGCEHYCQSAGGEVKCSCKRGYHVSITDHMKCEGE